MHETSCHWAWCRWYACLLDLKAHARVHRALLLSLNPHRSLGAMDTRLSANATSTRVSIYHNADQCAENVHSQIRTAAGKSPTVAGIQLPSNRRQKMHPVCCPALHSTSPEYGYTCPGLYVQNPERTYLSVRVALTTRIIFRPLKKWPYFPGS